MKDTTTALSLWKRPHIIYIAVAFGFSWLIWIVAWIVSKLAGTDGILYNAELIWAPLLGVDTVTSTIFLVSLLSLVGVYGPMIGAYVATKVDASISWKELWKSSTRFDGVKSSHFKKVFIILAAVVGIPTILTVLFTEGADNAPNIYGALLLLMIFFATQIVTSGTEEIGWRGYLTEKLLAGRDFWDTGWLVGIVWAVWHFPVLIFMFMQQEMVHVQIIGSTIGFSFGIIAMAILHAWFYAQTRQVSLNIFIHALFNAIPLTLVVLYIESPVAVLSNVLLWLVVIYIKRVHDRNEKIPASRHL